MKHFNIVNACSVVDLIILKSEPDFLKQFSKFGDNVINNVEGSCFSKQ